MPVGIAFGLLDGGLPGKFPHLRLLIFPVGLFQNAFLSQSRAASRTHTRFGKTDSSGDGPAAGGAGRSRLPSSFLQRFWLIPLGRLFPLEDDSRPVVFRLARLLFISSPPHPGGYPSRRLISYRAGRPPGTVGPGQTLGPPGSPVPATGPSLNPPLP